MSYSHASQQAFYPLAESLLLTEAMNICFGSLHEQLSFLIIRTVSTVEKYRARSKKLSSPTWKAFPKNRVRDLVSIDFFVVPAVRFKVLLVLVVLVHHRRRVVHFNVTEHPTAQWTGQQSLRTHLSLEMDSPRSRSVQLPAHGKIVEFSEVAGLHHHYERLAAG